MNSLIELVEKYSNIPEYFYIYVKFTISSNFISIDVEFSTKEHGNVNVFFSDFNELEKYLNQGLKIYEEFGYEDLECWIHGFKEFTSND